MMIGMGDIYKASSDSNSKVRFSYCIMKKGGNELTDDVTQRSVGQYGEIYAEYGTVRLFPVVDNYSLIIV